MPYRAERAALRPRTIDAEAVRMPNGNSSSLRFSRLWTRADGFRRDSSFQKFDRSFDLIIPIGTMYPDGPQRFQHRCDRYSAPVMVGEAELGIEIGASGAGSAATRRHQRGCGAYGDTSAMQTRASSENGGYRRLTRGTELQEAHVHDRANAWVSRSASSYNGSASGRSSTNSRQIRDVGCWHTDK
jgi:hypothetical protein